MTHIPCGLANDEAVEPKIDCYSRGRRLTFSRLERGSRLDPRFNFVQSTLLCCRRTVKEGAELDPESILPAGTPVLPRIPVPGLIKIVENLLAQNCIRSDPKRTDFGH
jgi:hypothetical protein